MQNENVRLFENYIFLAINRIRLFAEKKTGNIGLRRRVLNRIHSSFHNHVRATLVRRYGYILEKYINISTESSKSNNIIWVLWWQGLDQMPPLPKKCLEQMNKMNPGKVRLISKYNYHYYINIDERVVKKVEDGIFSITFFSDIIRFKLLGEYGGLWADSTIWMTKSVPDEFWNLNFLSIKKPDTKTTRWPGRMHYTAFFIGGKPKGYFKFCGDMLERYAIEEKKLINYFLVGYVISIAEVNNIDDFEKDIKNLPTNNERFQELVDYLNFPYNNDQFEILEDKYNWVFKLSWKKKFLSQIENKKTYFGKIIE